MTHVDPSTPAWLLDVAEDVTAYRNDPAAVAKMAAHGSDHDKRFRSAALFDAMREQDEDVWNAPLWTHRWSQLSSLLDSGKVVATAKPEESQP